ncbi:MAG: hypothetical protein KBA75_06235 [Alphaproteobacteria bacterium]|nr:hypothetical protein [Alphaproteobacteria bacterium]
MTKPLKTYDPNWEKRWDALQAQLVALRKRPQTSEVRVRHEELMNQQYLAFHAQFRTTGDFAIWMQSKISDHTNSLGLKDQKTPEFRPDASVEETMEFYRLNSVRLNMIAAGQRSLLPLATPKTGEPFGVTDSPLGSLHLDRLAVPYNKLIHRAGEDSYATTSNAVFGYAAQRQGGAAHVCLFEMGHKGPRVEPFIERIAAEVHQAHFAPFAPKPLGRPLQPERMGVYIYVPPYVVGEEKLYRVTLAWDHAARSVQARNFEPQEKVPFALRRLAAVEGVAPMPVAAQPKPAKLTWLQRWRLKGP